MRVRGRLADLSKAKAIEDFIERKPHSLEDAVDASPFHRKSLRGYSRLIFIRTISRHHHHLNYLSNSARWASSLSSCSFNLSSSSIFSSSADCLELISSLMICTLDAYVLFLSSRVYSSCFFYCNCFFRVSYSSCFCFNSSCLFLIFSLRSLNSFKLLISISTLALSIVTISLSSS